MNANGQMPTELRELLDKFQSRAEEILAPFKERLESSEPPSVIYHYTNDAGLKGILESGKIWLSDAFSLNDPSELRHGFSKFLEVLRSKAANGPTEARRFADQMHNFLDRIRDSAHYFICSFSANGDDLGQWRAYADNGCGYALGFDAKALEQSFASQSRSANVDRGTFPLTYNDAELSLLHGQLVDSMIHLISIPQGKNLSIPVLRAYLAELSVLLASRAMHTSLFFKHVAYKNEQEYRFLHMYEAGRVATKIRMRPYNLTRYVEFDWRSADPTVLREIVVGPAADWTKGSRFADDCVKAFHMRNLSLTRSEIPYRSG